MVLSTTIQAFFTKTNSDAPASTDRSSDDVVYQVQRSYDATELAALMNDEEFRSKGGDLDSSSNGEAEYRTPDSKDLVHINSSISKSKNLSNKNLRKFSAFLAASAVAVLCALNTNSADLANPSEYGDLATSGTNSKFLNPYAAEPRPVHSGVRMIASRSEDSVGEASGAAAASEADLESGGRERFLSLINGFAPVIEEVKEQPQYQYNAEHKLNVKAIGGILARADNFVSNINAFCQNELIGFLLSQEQNGNRESLKKMANIIVFLGGQLEARATCLKYQLKELKGNAARYPEVTDEHLRPRREFVDDMRKKLLRIMLPMTWRAYLNALPGTYHGGELKKTFEEAIKGVENRENLRAEMAKRDRESVRQAGLREIDSAIDNFVYSTIWNGGHVDEYKDNVDRIVREAAKRFSSARAS